MQTFQKGDTVRLKSGGPVMTIQHFNPNYEKDVACSWFVDNALKTGSFSSDSLEKSG